MSQENGNAASAAYAAFARHDWAALMAHFHDDAEVREEPGSVPDPGIYRGREEIEQLAVRGVLVAHEQEFLAWEKGLRAAGLDPDAIALPSPAKGGSSSEQRWVGAVYQRRSLSPGGQAHRERPPRECCNPMEARASSEPERTFAVRALRKPGASSSHAGR